MDVGQNHRVDSVSSAPEVTTAAPTPHGPYLAQSVTAGDTLIGFWFSQHGLKLEVEPRWNLCDQGLKTGTVDNMNGFFLINTA